MKLEGLWRVKGGGTPSLVLQSVLSPPADTRASLLPTEPCPHLRLVGGLASENIRWAESVENFRSQGATLCGDVLLISAFVSYVGYFTKKYRNELMERFWIPYINQLKVGGPVASITQDLWGGLRQGSPSQMAPLFLQWRLQPLRM